MAHKTLRIGILAHEFLINIGANDLLRNILRGLAHKPETEIFFLCPPLSDVVANASQDALREAYSLYGEVAPRMRFVPCAQNPFDIRCMIENHKLDLVMPSIHVLPEDFKYISYWPDCQPKHLPEFFDDASQTARDAMISGLLNTGRPMIINSRDAKNDMKTFYGAKPDQIFDLPFAPIIDAETLFPRPELRAGYEVEEPFFIVSNQWWLHKNIQTVFEATKILKDKGLAFQVAFTGRMQEPRRPSYIDELHAMIPAMGISDRIKLLGYIPKRDQLELMKWSTAVVQPTLFEGGPGGGSVYDAVSLGKRCIVSDLPVNRELPPNGLISFFPPRSGEHLAVLMEAALATPHRSPNPEQLYQQSAHYTALLSKRLYQAIDRVFEGEVKSPAAPTATASAHLDGPPLPLNETEWRALIRLAYNLFLKREPGAHELDMWPLQTLQDAHPSAVLAMIDAIRKSDEAGQARLRETGPGEAFNRLYLSLLGRPATNQELSAWTQQLANGRSFRELTIEIVESEEARAKAGLIR